MTNSKIPITIVVPVKNEERNLAGCLERLDAFFHVIVLDSQSTDKTPEIAHRYGAQLLQFKWNGGYPKKRNWLLLNHKFETDWVIFLDADEYVTPEFCQEAADAIASGKHVGYWLNYTNYFLGRELKHGLPQRKLAMLKIGSGLYERIDESAWSKLDMEIHEHPVIAGSTGHIKGRIDHRDFRGLEKFLDRHADYATWEAHRVALLEQEPEKYSHLTSRQKFKYRNVGRWWYPWFYFLYTYIVKRGFLDGVSGYYYAFYKAWYFLSIRLMAKQFKHPQSIAKSSDAEISLEQSDLLKRRSK